MMEHDSELAIPFETKAHQVEGATVEEFFAALESFKETNDRRLAELEARGSVDPLTEEKLRRVERFIEAQERRAVDAARPMLELSDRAGEEALQAKSAMMAYVRKGRTDGYEDLERKGMSVGSEADGGYLVPDETESSILKAMQSESPLRQLASTLTISSSGYKRPFAVSGAGAGWVAETGARTETTSPQLAEISYPAMELYASPAATKQLLDDAVVDVEAWIVDEIRSAFSEQESDAFINGDGVVKPKGILSYPRQPALSASFGAIGTVATGTAGDFDAEEPADALIDLVHSIGAKYRRQGTFLMNRSTMSRVRRLKDGNGDYLWQIKLAAGLETMLLGFPVAECEDMPDIAAGAAAIAFGDFKRGYLIVDRQGVQILRDPYSAKPYVLFYATKRVGGGVLDFNALRLLTFSAT
ncbi:MAG TPA: phage major capsid protein [Devosiaceae bacterium]|jgi:HK97 family phage major capsid protein|nr:phage major capsid protein [Devosiaceae bacterium]